MASINNPDPVTNYAELLDLFKDDIHSSAIVDWKTKRVKPDLSINGPYHRLNRTTYCSMDKDYVTFYDVDTQTEYNHTTFAQEVVGYYISQQSKLNKTSLEQQYIERRYNQKDNMKTEAETIEILSKMDEVYMVLENGKQIKLTDMNSFYDY